MIVGIERRRGLGLTLPCLAMRFRILVKRHQSKGLLSAFGAACQYVKDIQVLLGSVGAQIDPVL